MERTRDGPAASAPHRIGRLSFDLDGGEESALLRLRGNLVGGAESWIPAALDRAFAVVDEPGRTLRIDRLEIDLGVLPPEGVTAELLRQMVQAELLRRLHGGGMPDAPAPSIAEESATLAETLRFFLAHGRLPWWGVAERVAELELAIGRLDVDGLRALARVVAEVLIHLGAARRLVLQLDPNLAVRLAAALPAARPGMFDATWAKPMDGAAVEAMAARVRIAAGLSQVQREEAAGDSAGKPGEAAAERAADEAPAPSPGEHAEEAAAEESADAMIAVADAGLVLLHPFLPALFEARGLAAQGRFADDAARQHAIHLTAFLATGELSPREPELVIAKLLCGWPLDETVAPATLGDADAAEGDALLRAAIDHWTALGQASPAALRETFLLRPGRLGRSAEGWRLEVERRGTDVLLDRLPWGLGAVRLPWMRRPLFVEWG